MREEYYQARGWDENGIPTREKLLSLGLEEAAEKIKRK
jgi:aldehyde:ferredoxin oxidoreductase